MAGDLLKMRGVMSRLVAERTELGDREPIVVNAAPPRRVACAAAHRPPAQSAICCRAATCLMKPDILRLRAQLVELDSTVRQLQHAGCDSAVAELLLRRRRAELEDAIGRQRDQKHRPGILAMSPTFHRS